MQMDAVVLFVVQEMTPFFVGYRVCLLSLWEERGSSFKLWGRLISIGNHRGETKAEPSVSAEVRKKQ